MRKTPYARGKFHFGDTTSQQVKRDAARRLREVPPDTRDLTARICGDPIYERSALARKRRKKDISIW